MECKYVENKIIDYLEGKISIEDREKIEGHLKECEKCRLLINSVSSVWNSLTSSPKLELSPYFWLKLRNRILEYEKPRVMHFPILEKPLKYFKIAMVTAIFIFGIFSGHKLGVTYIGKELSFYQEKVDETLYLKVFNELPEDSMGEVYANFYKEF
jgi:predicted anti-sigma-YlaC factor YlaD